MIIDDDAEVLSALAALIEMEGYVCETYASALTYLQVLNDNPPCFPGQNCVLCDIKMPELDGLELQNRLAKLGAPLAAYERLQRHARSSKRFPRRGD